MSKDDIFSTVNMIFSSAQIIGHVLKTIFYLKTRTKNQNFQKKWNLDSTENCYV